VRIAAWERDGTIAKADLDARRADVKKLEDERDRLDVRPAPAKGSFFRYATKEIRENLGADPTINADLLAYYKTVNDANKIAFANRVPKPAKANEPAFMGVAICSSCHAAARTVWDGTKHAHAYATLANQFKQFNLDCVGCHVTGYDQAGGSTVTHVDKLEDVQCEVCHGPGSLHASHPDKVKVPVPKPDASVCIGCHHPPHVEKFDAAAEMQKILGPGHGRPL
jgi:hypothetical protein